MGQIQAIIADLMHGSHNSFIICAFLKERHTIKMLVLYLTILLLSFVGIYWSAQLMLDGAIETSHRHNISLTVIGVLVVGFGTSAPEILVSVLGAAGGSPEIALGNLLGSNFTNIALILGITAVLASAVFDQLTIRYYLIAVASLAVVGLFLALKETITWTDGLMLLALLIFFLWLMLHLAKQSVEAFADGMEETKTSAYCLSKLCGGLVALLLVCEATVWSAIKVSALLGINELIVGLTIVAIGTSLPELVASVFSAIRQQHSIAVGNLVGSNIFNSVGGVGFSALVAPLMVPPAIVARDFAVVFSVTLLLGLLIWLPRRLHIQRWKGVVLLLCFGGYLGLLYNSAVS